MNYYRIKKYCIANGMKPGKAEYVRKMILRLVQQKVAEAAIPPMITVPVLSRTQIKALVKATPFTAMSPSSEPIPGVTVATIRKCHAQLIKGLEPFVPEPTDRCTRCGATHYDHEEHAEVACSEFKAEGPK